MKGVEARLRGLKSSSKTSSRVLFGLLRLMRFCWRLVLASCRCRCKGTGKEASGLLQRPAPGWRRCEDLPKDPWRATDVQKAQRQ